MQMSVFMVLSSWHCHCSSSPGSFDKCSTSARRLPTFGPSRWASVTDPPIVSFSVYVFHHHLVLLLSRQLIVILPQHGG